MIRFNEYLSAICLAIAAFLFAASSQPALAQSVPPLGNAQSFAVLGGTAVTATGSAVISGNVGVSPGSAVTGFPPAVVQNGQIYSGVGSLAGPAQTSARNAYNNLKGQACPSSNNLTGKILGETPGFLTLSPGVYCFDTSAQLNATLTLNDGGDPNAIFVFQIGTTLTTASSSQVLMSSGGRGNNVYWQVGTSATIGTSTVFRGHIIADTSITLTTSASTTGRIFALDGAATIDSTAVNAVPTTIQFSTANFNGDEGCAATIITVTRTGDTSGVATVDFATSDGTGRQRTDYTLGAGTVTFAAGEVSKTFTVLDSKDAYNSEGMEAVNLTLVNPTGAALGSQSTATSNIVDDTSVLASSQPIDDASTFVCQHYHDFLARSADANGATFWTGQITQCGNDQACINTKRIDVSNAFYFEQEFQQTGAYVYRLYRESFGNSQPLANPHPDPLHPGEENKVPLYSVFMKDRAHVRGGSQLAQLQLDLANAFVLRPEFLAKYPASDGPTFVDALLATVTNDIGVNLTFQRQALIDLFTSGGRGKVVYRLADDNVVTNPINNAAFINAEYNRAFVFTQYAGYLRRDSDIAGFLFWLGQVNGAPLRDVTKQHSMVCAFITAAEYQQRFSAVVTHSNSECQ
ncbi:MAG: Antifreeze protein [Acidobacteria bacterium]|nr:Antifreeze protein [Acidobacteriota bacterium]